MLTYISDDRCIDNECMNGGTCIGEGDDYTCRCLRGFSKWNCALGESRNNIHV